MKSKTDLKKSRLVQFGENQVQLETQSDNNASKRYELPEITHSHAILAINDLTQDKSGTTVLSRYFLVHYIS